MNFFKLMLVSFLSLASFDMYAPPAEGQQKYTPLQVAAAKGETGSISELVKNGENVNAQTESSGNTAAHYAAMRGDHETLNALKSSGADFDIKNNEGQSVNDIIINKSNNKGGISLGSDVKEPAPVKVKKSVRINTDANQVLEIPNRSDNKVSDLLDKYGVSDINAKNENGNTALYEAARNGNNADVETLLAAGANVKQDGGNQGATALHVASASGHTDVMQTLIDNGADVNAVSSENKNTPLHVAGTRDATQLLIKNGATKNAINSKTGKTANLHKNMTDRFNDLTSWLKSLPKSMSDTFNNLVSSWSKQSPKQTQEIESNAKNLNKDIQDPDNFEKLITITRNAAVRKDSRVTTDNELKNFDPNKLKSDISNAVNDLKSLKDIKETNNNSLAKNKAKEIVIDDLVNIVATSRWLSAVDPTNTIERDIQKLIKPLDISVQDQINKLADEKVIQSELPKQAEAKIEPNYQFLGMKNPDTQILESNLEKSKAPSAPLSSAPTERPVINENPITESVQENKQNVLLTEPLPPLSDVVNYESENVESNIVQEIPQAKIVNDREAQQKNAVQSSAPYPSDVAKLASQRNDLMAAIRGNKNQGEESPEQNDGARSGSPISVATDFDVKTEEQVVKKTVPFNPVDLQKVQLKAAPASTPKPKMSDFLQQGKKQLRPVSPKVGEVTTENNGGTVSPKVETIIPASKTFNEEVLAKAQEQLKYKKQLSAGQQDDENDEEWDEKPSVIVKPKVAAKKPQVIAKPQVATNVTAPTKISKAPESVLNKNVDTSNMTKENLIQARRKAMQGGDDEKDDDDKNDESEIF